MTTKLDFYQRKLSSQTNKLRDHLQFVEDGSIGLNRKGKTEILAYLAKLDEIQRIMHALKTDNGPDLRSESNRFEMVQTRLFRQAAALLRAIGGGEGLKAARPAVATETDHPWWFIDVYVAQQQAHRIKQLMQWGGVLAAIGIVLAILFNTVLKPDPKVVAARSHYEAAFNLIAVDMNYDAALVEINNALAALPGDLESLIFKGVVLELSGRAQEAKKIFEQAFAVAPAPEYVLLGRGRLLLQLNHFEEALILGQEAIDLNPNFAEGWFLLGQAQERLGDMAAAFESMNTAADLALEQGNDALYAIIKVNIGYLSSPGGGGPGL